MEKYNNDIAFIYTHPKKIKWILILYTVCSISLIFTFCITKTYSKIKYKAIVEKDCLMISASVTNIDFLSKSDYFKIDDKQYEIDNIVYGEIYNNGQINIQDLKITSSYKNDSRNQVIDVEFYYNKENTLKKIAKGVLR